MKLSELISQLQVLLKRDGDKQVGMINNNVVHGPDQFYIRYVGKDTGCVECYLEIMYVNKYGDAIK